MRAAVYYGREDLRLEEVPEPTPGPGDVKLRVLYNGLCGSDLHEYYCGPVTTRVEPHPLTGVKNPVILGHELTGRVVELGAGVEDLAIGDKVAVEPLETCGSCLPCVSGQYNHCPQLAFHGYNRAGGGLAEFTVVKRSMAHRLPASLPDAAGALVEPMSVAYHTANRCQVEAGRTVAIHGAGPIGVGVYLTLRRRGVNVILCDPSPTRRGLVTALGARHVLDPLDVDVVAAIRDLTRGHGADASVDAAGVPSAFLAALRGTRVDGNVVVVAIHKHSVEIAPFDMLMSEVHITGVAMFCNAFPHVIAEMAAGAYPTDGWVETVAFDRLLSDGFERMRRQEAMKILIDIQGSSAAAVRSVP